LEVKGIYGYSRNPMYLAMLLCLLAWGLWLGNVFNTLVAAFFVSYMNRFQIVPEERALTRVFGREYQLYCSQVRRWF
jgi:protein-S-isoprenylcysteine O-methyltransferase Ste14